MARRSSGSDWKKREQRRRGNDKKKNVNADREENAARRWKEGRGMKDEEQCMREWIVALLSTNAALKKSAIVGLTFLTHVSRFSTLRGKILLPSLSSSRPLCAPLLYPICAKLPTLQISRHPRQARLASLITILMRAKSYAENEHKIVVHPYLFTPFCASFSIPRKLKHIFFCNYSLYHLNIRN